MIRAFGVLAAIPDTAVRDHRLTSNPARGVQLPRKVRREHVYLTHRQVHDLAEAAGSNRPMVLLPAYCRLHWGEAAGPRVLDCNLPQRRVRVVNNAVEVGSKVIVGTPKNHRRRTVPLPTLSTGSRNHAAAREPDDLLFPSQTGEHMRPPRGSGGWLESARKRATLPRLTPHDLRHTAASLSVSAGANVKAVRRMLGHSSAAMTLDVYADLGVPPACGEGDDDLRADAITLDHAVASAVGKLWADAANDLDA